MTGIVLLILAVVCLVLGIMVHTGRFDVLRTYHSNQDHSKESYRKAIGKCMVYAAAVLLGVGVAAFFVSSTVLFLLLMGAVVLIMIPLLVVQKRFNGRIF